MLRLCLDKLFCPSYSIFWDGQNNLKMIWKIVRKISRIIWFCEFWCDINDWDLKILYRDLESWKKWLKKNEMEWNGRFVRLKSWMV